MLFERDQILMLVHSWEKALDFSVMITTIAPQKPVAVI